MHASWHEIIENEEERLLEAEEHMEDWPLSRRPPRDEVILANVCPFDVRRVDTFIAYHASLNS